MTESEVIYLLSGLAAGLILGILVTLAFNKVRSGRISPAGIKKEMDAYQAQVETHFDETSKKFKNMTEQYKDLYQHLSVGATTLCRPENVAAGLTDQSNPLESIAKIESKESTGGATSKKTPAAQPKKVAEQTESKTPQESAEQAAKQKSAKAQASSTQKNSQPRRNQAEKKTKPESSSNDQAKKSSSKNQ